MAADDAARPVRPGAGHRQPQWRGADGDPHRHGHLLTAVRQEKGQLRGETLRRIYGVLMTAED